MPLRARKLAVAGMAVVVIVGLFGWWGLGLDGFRLDRSPTASAATASAATNAATAGYWLVASDGGVFSFGGTTFFGSTGGMHLNSPVVGMAATSGGGGYWLVASDGGIFAFGNANFAGSMGGTHLNSPVVGMAADPEGGYWLVAADGGIFAFGGAPFYGSTGGMHLNQPVVGMAVTPDGGGYWLVAADGGIFAYGDAAFYGSTGGMHLNQPVVGMTATANGGGYWLVAADGGIFAYGDAAFYGSTGGTHLNQPVVGMAATADGGGYWLAAADGGIFAYGDAAFYGSTGGIHLNKPVVGFAALAGTPTAGRQVCGNPSVLTGPSTPPAGAVTLPAGTNSNAAVGAPNTTYWLAPGTHTVGTGQFGQFQPANGDTYVGAPGAVINGQNANDYAFVSNATGVTVEYLTIENFVAPQSEGVVNQNSASNWTIGNDTIQNNPNGAGAMLGTNDVLTNSCLTKNGQYGFQSYSAAGPSNVTVTNNEVSYNDTQNYTANTSGCGCAGGAKFWDTNGATVTGNYVHDNEDVGLWADTNNRGFDISYNYIANNYAEGIMYEISYNALISHNDLVGNAVGAGSRGTSNLYAAIYVSESGSDPRVPGPYGNSFAITDNIFTDNWSGVNAWESSNRYCGSPDNSSATYCTLVDPSVYTVASCAAHVPTSSPGQTPDYYDNCRWKTQNLSITGNTFTFDPSAMPAACTVANGCGVNSLISQYGTLPPYQGDVVPDAISKTQNNHYADNAYHGPWNFEIRQQGTFVPFATWQSTWGQDAGSTTS